MELAIGSEAQGSIRQRALTVSAHEAPLEEAAAPELSEGECSLLVRVQGADPRGVAVTIGRGSGPFQGREFKADKSLTRPLVPAGSMEGQVAFSRLKRGQWSVQVLDAEGRMRRARVRFRDDELTQELLLKHGPCGVEGTVWDSNGAPWPGVTVKLTIEHRSPAGVEATPWRGWCVTNESGHYRLDGYAVGRGRMSVDTKSGSEVSTRPGGKLMNEVFVFRREGRRTINFGSPLGTADVHLTIRDSSGRRLTNGHVQLIQRPPASKELYQDPKVQGLMNDRGEISFEAVPGLYGVKLSQWGAASGVIGEIDVVDSSTLQADVSLETGRSIYGSLIGADGAPLTGVRTVRLRRGPSPGSKSVHTLESRQDGVFSFQLVEPGDYYVSTGRGDAFSSLPVSVPARAPFVVDVVLPVRE